MSALDVLLDPGSSHERDAGLQSVDLLGFVDQKPYPDRLAAAQVATGMREAAVWGSGRSSGRPVALCVMDFGFMGGSMGAVVGEKITRAAEARARGAHPADRRRRVRRRTDAGGHARPDAARQDRRRARATARGRRAVHQSILTDPTTGGVFASFAALGDINLAEPNSLIGFAGARVSAGTIAQELPPGFQRAEFLFEHGFVDRVVAPGRICARGVEAPRATSGRSPSSTRQRRRAGASGR